MTLHLVTGSDDNYAAGVLVLIASAAFHTPEEVADLFSAAGFVNIGHQLHMFGTLAIHWAMKPVA